MREKKTVVNLEFYLTENMEVYEVLWDIRAFVRGGVGVLPAKRNPSSRGHRLSNYALIVL